MAELTGSIRDGRKRRMTSLEVQKELTKELADVIHYTVAIAAVNSIDLEKIILEKTSLRVNITIQQA